LLKKFLVASVLVVSLLIGTLVSAEEPVTSGYIQVKGSDTMVNLGQAWAEGFMEKYPEAMIAVTGGGSGTGIAAMINGTTDIAECSREMKEKEIEQAKANKIEPIEFVVALDGIAIVVHPSNPVSDLTFQQLSEIFTGKIKNWKEVGGNDEAIVLLSRESNSGTHVYFKEHILNCCGLEGQEFSPEALLMPSSQSIADEVAQNPKTIGYYGMGYISEKQKAMVVAKDENSPYVEPTIDNVISGDYPVSRPLYFYTAGEPKGLVKTYVDFVLSDEGQDIVLQLDFVPIKK